MKYLLSMIICLCVGCGSSPNSGVNGLDGTNGSNGVNGSQGIAGTPGVTISKVLNCPQATIVYKSSFTIGIAYQEITYSNGFKQVNCSINDGRRASQTHILASTDPLYASGTCVIDMDIVTPSNDYWTYTNSMNVLYTNSTSTNAGVVRDISTLCTIKEF